jgi:thiamine-monophosphate kinase
MTEEKEGMHLITRANQKLPLIARGWNSMDDKDSEEK